MRYFRDVSGQVFGFDDPIDSKKIVDKIELTNAEVTDLLNPQKTTTEKIKEYTSYIDALIQSKIDAYNMSNGVAFQDVHSCELWSRVPNYSHAPFCQAIWAWVSTPVTGVWETARSIQNQVLAGTMVEPTKDEFLAMLPVFTF